MSDTGRKVTRSGGVLVESKIVPINKVKPNTWNGNEMDDTVYQFLKRSIGKHGFLAPIIVTADMTIIDGEHRWRAMKERGEKEIEVKVLDISDEEAKAETINLNLTKGEFNQEKLALILNELTKNKTAEDIENMLVMRRKEVDRLIGTYCGSSELDVKEVDVPVSDFRQVTTDIRRGDILKLGNHKLMCGDSTNWADILTLFGSERADMCVTSPPYYNQREYSQWETYEDYLAFCEKVIRYIRDAAKQSSFVCCWNMGSAEIDQEFIPADNYIQFKRMGFRWIEWIVWKKQCAQWNIPRSRNIHSGLYIPALRWESICVYLLGTRPRFDMHDIKKVIQWQENLWEMQKVLGNQMRNVGHPAMFPIELPARCILSFSQKDALVYEPFAGSGQTLLAAEQTGRRCYAIDLSPEYCEITAHRWEQMTGKHREVIKHGKRVSESEEITSTSTPETGVRGEPSSETVCNLSGHASLQGNRLRKTVRKDLPDGV